MHLSIAESLSPDFFFELCHKDGAPRAVADVVALVGGGLVAKTAFVVHDIVRAVVSFLLLVAL
jgi:hypothetical protein